MSNSRVLLVAVFLGLSSGLSRPIFAQQVATIRDDSPQPLEARSMEQNAALEEAVEAPAEPDFREPVRRSFLVWLLQSLGWRYTLLLPASTLLSFVLLLVIVIRGRGWAAGAAAVLLVPLPLLVGLMGTIDGLIQSYMAIASLELYPKPSHVAEVISSAQVSLLAGMVLTIPTYWLAVIGLIVRSFRDDQQDR